MIDHHDEHFEQPVLDFAREDFTCLPEGLSVAEALDYLRQRKVEEAILYFYVVDAENRLVGVIPTRRMLTSPPDTRLSEIMVSKVVTIPHTATVLEACEFFTLYKYLAFPVVDEQRHLVGVVDVVVFTQEVFDLAEREQTDGVFEAIGFRVAQLKGASSWRAFRLRIPWISATLTSGLLCAMLASAFEATLMQSVVVTLFLALVLGLAESVSVQSMTLAIQSLHAVRPTRAWYARAIGRELFTSVMLGLTCALLVAAVAWIWREDTRAALALGTSIVVTIAGAAVLGLSIPSLLHALRLDPKIAAGPVTLALTDTFTLFSYFTLVSWIT